MTATVVYFNVAIFAFRLWLTAQLFGNYNLSSILFGVVSTLAVITTVISWSRGVIDLSWGGLGIAVLHLSPLLVQPGESSLVMQGVFNTWFGLQLVTKYDLWDRCTVTAPVFSKIQVGGMYSFVRHPMNLCEMMMSLTLCFEAGGDYNVLLVAPLIVISKLLIVNLEERFLSKFQPWREYAKQVKYKLIPYVY